MTEPESDNIELIEQREEKRSEERDRTVRIAVALGLLVVVVIAFGWILVDYRSRVARDNEVAAAKAVAKKADDAKAAKAKASTPATQTKVATPTAPPAPMLVVVQDGIRLRSSADGSADVIQTLKAGVKLKIIGQVEGWYNVATANNVKGWVRSGSEYVKKAQ
jgi:hypothetical protein